LGNIRVTLTDEKSRKHLENRLAELNNTFDWFEVVEYICIKTLNHFRQGEPVVRLGMREDIPPLEYQLYPLVLKNEHNVLFGDGGTGKSYVSALIATLIQYNKEHLGLVPQQGNVLIADWETSELTWERRINAIKRGLGLEGSAFFYRFCERPLVDDIEEIQRQVADNNIQVIIVDSAGLAAGLEGDFHASAIKYARALRSLRITSITVDHITKNEGDKPFGSVYKHNIARSAYKIRHVQNPGESDLYIGLYHTKANEGPRLKPRGFHLQFDGDEFTLKKVTFGYLDISEVPELADELPIRDRLCTLLSRAPMTITEMAEELGKPEASIRTVLYRYRDRYFVKLGNQWELKAYDEDEPL
jgi:hypothetical protein